MDMKLEFVVVPVSGVDRSKRFYEKPGFRLDIDLVVSENFRVVQFTPPGSEASIHIGKGITPAAPGSLQNVYLVVFDIEEARQEAASWKAGESASHCRYDRRLAEGPLRVPQRRTEFTRRSSGSLILTGHSGTPSTWRARSEALGTTSPDLQTDGAPGKTVALTLQDEVRGFSSPIPKSRRPCQAGLRYARVRLR